jgi:hypothetical protein
MTVLMKWRAAGGGGGGDQPGQPGGGSEQPATPAEEERQNAMAEELAGATQLDGVAPPAVRACDASFTLSVVQGLRGTPGDLMREVHTQPDRFVM